MLRWMSSATLQDGPSVESYLNVVETETLPWFEHLSSDFLGGFGVFAPAETGGTRDHEPPQVAPSTAMTKTSTPSAPLSESFETGLFG